MVEVNWLAVVVGTVGYVVLGALWYGPLFGSAWMRSMGYAGPEDVEGEDSWTNYALTAFGSLVAGLGFVSTAGLQAVPFEDRTWTTYALSVCYNVVALAGIGVLLVVL